MVGNTLFKFKRNRLGLIISIFIFSLSSVRLAKGSNRFPNDLTVEGVELNIDKPKFIDLEIIGRVELFEDYSEHSVTSTFNTKFLAGVSSETYLSGFIKGEEGIFGFRKPASSNSSPYLKVGVNSIKNGVVFVQIKLISNINGIEKIMATLNMGAPYGVEETASLGEFQDKRIPGKFKSLAISLKPTFAAVPDIDR